MSAPVAASGAKRFAGKVVVLVGAGTDVSGSPTNGSASAIAYAREGARVFVVDRVEAAARRTVSQIGSEGGAASFLLADVTIEDQVQAAVAEVLAAAGRIDVLHNNVGSTLMGLPPELDLAQWNSALAVNLSSVFLSCKYVLPVMTAQRSGAIINISSLASLRDTGYPYPAYSAAKGAVNQLTVALALQYAREGIRVNAIAPGYIDSPLIYREISSQYSSVEEMRRERDAHSPTGRMGTPWDVAEASLFLASDAASFINGVVLPVDGGQHMRSL
jgi:NAD(P)-dependent dehydrogenase (short-subunit alcohol dehydrogenase family)